MFKRNRLKRNISTLGEDVSNEAKKPCLEKSSDDPQSTQSQVSIENLELQVIPIGSTNAKSIEKHELVDATNVEVKPRSEKISDNTEIKSVHVINAYQKIIENNLVSTEINQNLSHPQKCLHGEMKSDANGMERCPVCKGNISNMDAKSKEEHLNKCFNNEELTEKQKKIEKEFVEKEMKKILPCPICGKQLKTYNSRVSHLKKCSTDYNVEPSSLMQLIMKQTEERDSLLKEKFPGSLRDKLMTALNTASLKKFKQAPKRNKLKFEEPKTKFDEDVQLAIALSTSMDAESEEIKMVDKKLPPSNPDAFQVLTSAITVRGGRKNKRTRPPELVHPLMAIGFEDCRMLIKDKFSKMLSEKTSLTTTLSHVNGMKAGVRRSNLIEKYQSKRCLWTLNSFADAESKSCLKLFLVPEIFETQITDSKETAFLVDWRQKNLLPSQWQQITQVPFTQTAHLLADLATDYTHCGDLNNMEGDCQDSNKLSREASSTHIPVEKKSLMCYLPMVNNPILSDLKLILDGEHVFHVHKFVLLVRCPKFYEVISDKSEYLLETFTMQTIHSFFEYIYASIISLDESTVHPLLQLAQRFEILELADVCRDYMKSLTTRMELFEYGHNEDIIKDGEEQDENNNDDSEDDDTSLDEVYEYMFTQRKLKQKRIDNIEIDTCSEEVELSLENKIEQTFQCLPNEQSKELSETGLSEKISVSDIANHVTEQKETCNVKVNYLTNTLIVSDISKLPRLHVNSTDNSILKSLNCVDSTILREFELDMDCSYANNSNNDLHLDMGQTSSNPAMLPNKFNRSCSPDLFTSRSESLAFDTSMQVKDKVTYNGSIFYDIQKQQSIVDSRVDAFSQRMDPKCCKDEDEGKKEDLFNVPEYQYEDVTNADDQSDVLYRSSSPSDGDDFTVNKNISIKNDEGWMDDGWEDFQESFHVATSSPLISNVPLSQPILQQTPRRGQWRRSLSQYETPSRRLQTRVQLNASFSPPTDVSHLDSPSHTEDPSVYPDTPISTPSTKQMGARNCPTPILKYESMNTPVLKDHCHNFGVRALPKSKMVKVLKNIYYGTHPNAQRTPAVANKKASKVSRKGRKSKETNPKMSEPILPEDKKTTKHESTTASKPTSDETKKSATNHTMAPKDSKKVFTFKKKQPIKHFTSPNEVFFSSGDLNQTGLNLPIASDTPDTRPSSSTNRHFMSSQSSRNLSGSIGDEDDEDEEPDDERRCIEEEHFRSDEENDYDDGGEIAQSQKSKRKYEKLTDEQKKEKLYEFFQEDRHFLKILHYEPFELNELADSIKSKNIKISKQFLIEYMDEKNILFTTRGSNKNGHHRPKTASNNYKMPSKMYNELI